MASWDRECLTAAGSRFCQALPRLGLPGVGGLRHWRQTARVGRRLQRWAPNAGDSSAPGSSGSRQVTSLRARRMIPRHIA
eukprot:3967017-Pyramimonas_sp.AAC.1